MAEAFKQGPVYVDPRAARQLPKAAADKLAARIEAADKPVFVAVLPATSDYPKATLLVDLRSRTGNTGVYAVRLGAGFDAGADPRVMSRTAIINLNRAVRHTYASDAEAQVNAFVDKALKHARGSAPRSWAKSGDSGVGTGDLLAAVLVAAGAGGGVFLLRRRTKKRRQERERAELESVHVVDEAMPT